MEENTSKSCSTKSCCFSFIGVLKAGFFAAILTNLLMVFQGSNALFYFGTLFLGAEADPKIVYTVGVLTACVLGIIFAFIYALIIAPWRCVNDLIKAIIFAVILTAISYYASPELPKAANMITGHSGASTSLVSAEATEHPADEGEAALIVAGKPVQLKVKKSIVTIFSNSLIFALMVVVLYRRRYWYCSPDSTCSEKVVKH